MSGGRPASIVVILEKKSGLIYEGETPVERYENFVCKLTFEPLPREKISFSIGRLCPLEFEEQKGEEMND